MALTLAEAEKVLQASKAKAEAMGVPMTIAVVDTRGDLVAYGRMDGSRWFTGDIARGKAAAAAGFGRDSKELTQLAELPFFRSLLLMQQGHLVPSQGGVVIRKNEEVVGAVGASGGSGEQDEEVAQAGVAAL